MQSVTASFSACVLPAASPLHTRVRAGAPGLPGGSEGKDQRGGEGVGDWTAAVWGCPTRSAAGAE